MDEVKDWRDQKIYIKVGDLLDLLERERQRMSLPVTPWMYPLPYRIADTPVVNPVITWGSSTWQQ